MDKTDFKGCPYLFFKKMDISKQEEKLLKKPSSVKELALGMAAYTGVSTFGPIVFFGFLGFFLDKVFDTKPFLMIAGIGLAFVTTNILIYKKINILIKKFSALDKEQEENNKK